MTNASILKYIKKHVGLHTRQFFFQKGFICVPTYGVTTLLSSEPLLTSISFQNLTLDPRFLIQLLLLIVLSCEVGTQKWCTNLFTFRPVSLKIIVKSNFVYLFWRY